MYFFLTPEISNRKINFFQFESNILITLQFLSTIILTGLKNMQFNQVSLWYGRRHCDGGKCCVFLSAVILFYFILFYFILFYFNFFYFILFYFILFYSILFYFILFYFILFYFILFYFILFYFILFYFIFYSDRSQTQVTIPVI